MSKSNNDVTHIILHVLSAGTFLLEVNNREIIAATEVNNDTYCLQKRIEKFRLKILKQIETETLKLSLMFSDLLTLGNPTSSVYQMNLPPSVQKLETRPRQ